MADRSVKPVDFRIEFRVFQSKIAKKLKEADRQALMYIYGDYIPESLKRATALELLSHLETEDVFSVYAPNTFVDILRHLERFDLAKEAEKYLKQTEKYFKQLSTKADKLKSKKTSQKPMFLTAEDAALKARFDCILLQATLQVEELEKLRVDLAAKDEQNQDSQELLKQCEESAAKLKCELRKARSASKLSDNSFSAATNVVTALKDVCDKVNALMPEGTPLQPSSVLELERAAQSAPNSPFNTMHRETGTKKQPMIPPSRKLPWQSRTARITSDEAGTETGDGTGGEGCELYDTRDLLQDKPYLHADVRRRAQSLPNSPKQMRKTLPARTERTVPPALPRHNHDPATDSTPEYTTPDQSQSITEGGTGDSGFEEPFLKVPLRPKVMHSYTPLSEDTIDRLEDVVYDATEDQGMSRKGIMNPEHVYENFPSRESKGKQQLITMAKRK